MITLTIRTLPYYKGVTQFVNYDLNIIGTIHQKNRISAIEGILNEVAIFISQEIYFGYRFDMKLNQKAHICTLKNIHTTMPKLLTAYAKD